MSVPGMTIAQVQRHFVSPLSPADVEHYQARLDIAVGIEWKNGAYYAIGDKGRSTDAYSLYQCLVEDGVVYLGEEDASGDTDDFKPVYFVLYAGCAVIPQL